ncbi:hypothetical protein SCWH03_17670 [Streptomyces pacificus]|uniref:Uncharacterized protein n=1 Tax=Streptomyces pacificus TaxID=2705029 RepID=A0A6A0ARL2_9ACTN|nr:hypothetical protein SCWH03_17670 [Streptomyces pacificus]
MPPEPRAARSGEGPTPPRAAAPGAGGRYAGQAAGRSLRRANGATSQQVSPPRSPGALVRAPGGTGAADMTASTPAVAHRRRFAAAGSGGWGADGRRASALSGISSRARPRA